MNISQRSVLFAALCIPSWAAAQTCSCASVPLLGTMETSSPVAGRWFISATYEKHDLNKLVSGSDTVHDTTGRDREAESFVLETSYGVNDQWSVSALLSSVKHTRQVGSGFQQEGSGIGDAIVLAKYSLKNMDLFNHTGYAVGFGARAPVGKDDEKSNGIVLAEDLQPSTGAWGAILWAHAAHKFDQAGRWQVQATATYTRNYENDRDYRFGDEATLTTGVTFQPESAFGYSANLRYRHADRDERDSASIPNTGGEWLEFTPALQYAINEKWAARAALKIPLWRDLNDALQFTTKNSWTVSVNYAF